MAYTAEQKQLGKQVKMRAVPGPRRPDVELSSRTTPIREDVELTETDYEDGTVIQIAIKRGSDGLALCTDRIAGLQILNAYEPGPFESWIYFSFWKAN